MSALGKLLVTILFIALLFWVAVGNRAPVDFSLPPFVESSQIPVALLMLGAMVAGFIWGAAIVWLNGASVRSENRRQRKEIKTLEQEINQKEKPV